MANLKIKNFKKLKNCASPPYWKMAAIQDGDQNKTIWRHADQTKVICIIIRSIACLSRPYEYQLDNLHINQGRMNIN